MDAFLSLGLGLVAALASFFLQFPLLFLYVSCLPLATASSPSSTSCSPPSVLVLKSSDATSGSVQPCLGLLELLPPPSSLPSAFLPQLPHFAATGRSPDNKQPQRLISVFRQLLDLVEAPHPLLPTLLPGIFGGFGLFALRVGSSLHGGVVSPSFPLSPVFSLCRLPLISREVSGQVGCLPCGWLRF